MGKIFSPRRGSLQYWPRKRARKILPSVNWNFVSKATKADKGLLGFICYKAGMKSAVVEDKTDKSMTKNKKITIPATILEAPPLKIFSVRFYKHGKVINEILFSSEKELKKRVKLPKSYNKKIEDVKDYDDVRLIVYSLVKKTSIKKTPDLIELGLAGSLDEKINFVKENANKEILIKDIFKTGELIDLKAVTKGKGFQGVIKRFGVKLRFHKSEKGVRKVGSIGPWHPAHVSFRVPMAGQTGYFTRMTNNLKILSIDDKELELRGYGKTKNLYLIVKGSVHGSLKRQVVITKQTRKTKRQEKKNLQFLKLD